MHFAGICSRGIIWTPAHTIACPEVRSSIASAAVVRPRNSDAPPLSGLEIECGLVAAVHEKRHELVLVREIPFAIDLAEAERTSEPDVARLAALARAGQVVKAVAEGDPVAGHDFEIAQLVAERALPGVEPSL